MKYDLCFAWTWQYDSDFAQFLESACQPLGVSVLHLGSDNVTAMSQALQSGELEFLAFYDRASDSEGHYIPFVNWARERRIHQINPFRSARRAWNKVICHEGFVRTGLRIPYTLILPSYEERPEICPMDLTPLGTSFSIKPAHGGGGLGVVTGATTWEQVLAARMEYPADQYLLQAYVVPASFEGREAWFRIIFCDGQVYPSWWHTQTHVYTPVTEEEEVRFSLGPLREITAKIAEICGLDLFSTEIALSMDGLFIVVDYVNDPIDLRLKSKAVDGVPDEIVGDIARRLAERIASAVGAFPPLALPVEKRFDPAEEQYPGA